MVFRQRAILRKRGLQIGAAEGNFNLGQIRAGILIRPAGRIIRRENHLNEGFLEQRVDLGRRNPPCARDRPGRLTIE